MLTSNDLDPTCVDARAVSEPIALFKRVVGLYAGQIGINTYHQPAAEADKKAPASVLTLQGRVVSALSSPAQSAQQLAVIANAADETETVYPLLEHLAANGRAGLTSLVGLNQTTFVTA